MHFLRGLLLDNLGLKFTALLLAVLVYLNVFTDRQATLLVSFPIEYQGLPDTLTLSGAAPTTVQAELRGTGKQLIGLRVREPRFVVDLEGVHAGRYERGVSPGDLPLPVGSGLAVERLMGPLILELTIEKRVTRDVPMALPVLGVAATGFAYEGEWHATPSTIRVTGPADVLAELDTVRLTPLRIDGRRDSVAMDVGPERLPLWCRVEPLMVRAVVRLPRVAL